MDDSAGQKPFMKLKISSAKPTGEAASAPQDGASAPVPATPDRAKTASPFMTPPAALSPSASTTGPVLRTFKPAAPGTVSPATSDAGAASLPPVPGPAPEAPSASGEPAPATKTYEEGPSKKLKLQKLPPPGTVAPTPAVSASAAGAVSAGAPKVSAAPAPAAPTSGAPTFAPMSTSAAKPASEAKTEDSGPAASAPAGVPVGAASAPLSAPSAPVDVAPPSSPAPKVEGRPAPAKAPAATATRPVAPVVLIGAAIGGLLVLCFLAFRMATSAVPVSVPAPEVESGRAVAPPSVSLTSDRPATDAAPGVTESPKAGPDTDRVDGTGEVEVARTRDAELSLWLDSARVTSVSSDRITLNRRVYALGSAVNAEGTLKWVGRDTVKGSLLFMDKAGVVYEKSVR